MGGDEAGNVEEQNENGSLSQSPEPGLGFFFRIVLLRNSEEHLSRSNQGLAQLIYFLAPYIPLFVFCIGSGILGFLFKIDKQGECNDSGVLENLNLSTVCSVWIGILEGERQQEGSFAGVDGRGTQSLNKGSVRGNEK